jgi:hypothetical protein
MMVKRILLIHVVLILATLLFSPAVFAKTTPKTQEIRVFLLGQLCLIQGPFEQATLKRIHDIGPAQIYPNLSSLGPPQEKVQIQDASKKLRTSPVPALLDRYKEKLLNRFDAQIAFLDALNSYRKTLKAGIILKTGKDHLREKDFKKFQLLVNKLGSSSPTSAKGREMLEQLFDLYNEAIEPDPESEFHRAIKKLNVQYTCSFEESDDLGED